MYLEKFFEKRLGKKNMVVQFKGTKAEIVLPAVFSSFTRMKDYDQKLVWGYKKGSVEIILYVNLENLPGFQIINIRKGTKESSLFGSWDEIILLAEYWIKSSSEPTFK